MKKLSLALIASTVALGATQANISSGFYAGGAVGYGETTAKYAITGLALVPGAADVGAGSGNIGIHGGYGWVDNCLYVGGELAATYDNSKVNNTINQGANQGGALGTIGGTQLKRNGYFNAALRGGYFATPTTIVYLRLGANWSKWTFRDSGITANPFGSNIVGNGSRTRITFVPGLGFETALTKSLYARFEYTYEFGPDLHAINSSATGTTSINEVRNQSGKVGLSYKFLGNTGESNVTAVSASHAHIGTGFYAGGALGYGATQGKYSVTSPNGAAAVGGSTDVAGLSGNIGLHGGYGLVYNCFYVGGEVAYTFDQSKINDTTSVGQTVNGGTQLKRNGYSNIAVRGGYLVAPATLLYLRLGASWSKWHFTDAGLNPNLFNTTLTGTGSKNSTSFVPGLGSEIALKKNVYMRLEYTYEFGPSIRAANANQTGFTTIANIRSQSGKAGLSYKF